MKYTFEFLQEDIQKVLPVLLQEKFEKIICITKGGLIPTYYVAKKLRIHKIETINISSYEDKKRGTLKHYFDDYRKWQEEIDKIKDKGKVLIIDDIIDTGKTLNYVKSIYPNGKEFVLVRKEGARSVDYFGRSVEYPIWVDFYWE